MEQTPEKSPVIVCDIQFRNNTKIYFFDPGELKLNAGDEVIIDTSRGAEFGLCVHGNHEVSPNEIVTPLRPVIRLATAQDKKTNEENREREKRAHEICLKKIEELGLDMQLVSTEYAFDGSKILFFFTADGRVDFRELVKNLASVLRTRIADRPADLFGADGRNAAYHACCNAKKGFGKVIAYCPIKSAEQRQTAISSHSSAILGSRLKNLLKNRFFDAIFL